MLVRHVVMSGGPSNVCSFAAHGARARARTHQGHQPVAMVGTAGGSDLDTGTHEARAVHR